MVVQAVTNVVRAGRPDLAQDLIRQLRSHLEFLELKPSIDHPQRAFLREVAKLSPQGICQVYLDIGHIRAQVEIERSNGHEKSCFMSQYLLICQQDAFQIPIQRDHFLEQLQNSSKFYGDLYKYTLHLLRIGLGADLCISGARELESLSQRLRNIHLHGPADGPSKLQLNGPYISNKSASELAALRRKVGDLRNAISIYETIVDSSSPYRQDLNVKYEYEVLKSLQGLCRELDESNKPENEARLKEIEDIWKTEVEIALR